MKQFIHALGLAALLATGLAAPARAEVVDRAGVLSGTEIQQLERDLAALGPHRVEVVFEDKAPGLASRAAKQVFKDAHLGLKDAAIFVAVKDRKVGVHVGEGFTARGVDADAISRHIKADFFPAAKGGDYEGAALALARGLIAEGAGSPSRPGAPHRQGDGGGGGGGVLFVILLLVGGGVGYFIWNGRRQVGADLGKRLASLNEMHSQVLSASLKLDEVEALSRFAEGGAAEGYRKLVQRSNRVLGEVRSFGERLEQAEADHKAGKHAAAAELVAGLEEQATTLASGLAATLTAVERLESGKGTAADADLPERAERLVGRVHGLKEAYAAERKRAGEFGVGPETQLERHMERALKCLTSAPVDLSGATEATGEAETLLDAYRERLAEEAERRAYEARTTEMNRAHDNGGGFVAGAVLGSMLSGESHHSHQADSNAGWDSGWSADEGGASAEESWGDSGSSSSEQW